jgi:hypothetical protein
MREVFYEMRLAEDYLSLIHHNIQPIDREDIVEIDKLIPIQDTKNLNPFLIPTDSTWKNEDYQSGDVFLIKGKMLASSVVSRLSVKESLFSHLAIVHVDEKTRKVEVVQSFGNTIVKIYSLSEFLAYDNMRIVLFRPKDPVVGKNAARFIYNKVKEANKNNVDIPYDFYANYKDMTQLDCAEVIYQAYRNSGSRNYILPEIQSEINLPNKEMRERFLISNGPRMFPVDMETDSRFDILWDWTSYKLIREAWMRDAIVSTIFRWENELNFKLKFTIGAYQTYAIWSLRHIPFVWDALMYYWPHLKSVSHHVPTTIVTSTAMYLALERPLLKRLRELDREHFLQKGEWATMDSLKLMLDHFRKRNAKFIPIFYEFSGVK